MLLTYCRHTSLQDNCIWFGQVFSERYHSKCAHTILYHSFRLRWSLLVGRSYVGLSTTSVLNYWTVCSQKPLVASQSYIHRLSAHLDTSKYTSSCIPKWLCAWVGHSSPPWQGSLCHELNKQENGLENSTFLFLKMMRWRKKT